MVPCLRRSARRSASAPSSSSSSEISSRLKVHFRDFFLSMMPVATARRRRRTAPAADEGVFFLSSTCSWQSAKGKQKRWTKTSLEYPGMHWPLLVMPNCFRVLWRKLEVYRAPGRRRTGRRGRTSTPRRRCTRRGRRTACTPRFACTARGRRRGVVRAGVKHLGVGADEEARAAHRGEAQVAAPAETRVGAEGGVRILLSSCLPGGYRGWRRRRGPRSSRVSSTHICRKKAWWPARASVPASPRVVLWGGARRVRPFRVFVTSSLARADTRTSKISNCCGFRARASTTVGAIDPPTPPGSFNQAQRARRGTRGEAERDGRHVQSCEEHGVRGGGVRGRGASPERRPRARVPLSPLTRFSRIAHPAEERSRGSPTPSLTISRPSPLAQESDDGDEWLDDVEDVSKDAELTEEDLRALESPAVTPKCAGPGNPAFGTAGSDAFDAAETRPSAPTGPATSPRAPSLTPPGETPSRPRPQHAAAAQDRAQVGRGEAPAAREARRGQGALIHVHGLHGDHPPGDVKSVQEISNAMRYLQGNLGSWRRRGSSRGRGCPTTWRYRQDVFEKYNRAAETFVIWRQRPPPPQRARVRI